MSPCHFAPSQPQPSFPIAELELRVRKVLHSETAGHSHIALSHPGGWNDPPGSHLLPPSSASTQLPPSLLAAPSQL